MNWKNGDWVIQRNSNAYFLILEMPTNQKKGETLMYIKDAASRIQSRDHGVHFFKSSNNWEGEEFEPYVPTNADRKCAVIAIMEWVR
jgi:hypothetical protein